MYAYELFEHIKSKAIEYKNRQGHEAMQSIFNNLCIALTEREYFSDEDASRAVIGAVACVMANDGRISRAEYESFRNANSSFRQMSYDDFFNLMATFNRQENRDRTIVYFDRIRSEEVALWFIQLCVMSAVVDGNVALDEELFCESLCESFLNRFDN